MNSQEIVRGLRAEMERDAAASKKYWLALKKIARVLDHAVATKGLGEARSRLARARLADQQSGCDRRRIPGSRAARVRGDVLQVQRLRAA